MTEGANDKRLATIMALLAKAERTNHAEEAKTYTAKAQELMTKWAIDEAMLDQASGKSKHRPSEPVGHEFIWIDYSPYQNQTLMLLQIAADVNDVKIIFSAGHVKRDEDGRPLYTKSGAYVKGGKVYMVGYETNRKLVRLLFASLVIQAESAYRSPDVQERQAAETSHPGHRIRWRNSFMQGYAWGVRQKVEAAKKKATEEMGAAVVLYDRALAVQTEYDRMFPKQHKVRSNSGGGDGTGIGIEKGLQADIGQPRVGAEQREAVGS